MMVVPGTGTVATTAILVPTYTVPPDYTGEPRERGSSALRALSAKKWRISVVLRVASHRQAMPSAPRAPRSGQHELCPTQLHHLSAGLASAFDDRADRLRRLARHLVEQMRIAGRGRGLSMPEQLADDRKAVSRRRQERRIAVLKSWTCNPLMPAALQIAGHGFLRSMRCPPPRPGKT